MPDPSNLIVLNGADWARAEWDMFEIGARYVAITHAEASQRIKQTTEKIADFVLKLLKLTHLLKQVHALSCTRNTV